MNAESLQFENPINDAISRIRFAPKSNNILISSWDSNLRLYDVDKSVLRLEAPTEGALFDCCFHGETVAYSAGIDCSITRYDLHSGIQDSIGQHGDLATCVEYSEDTSQLITAGWDKKIMFWDTRVEKTLAFSKCLGAKVESMSLSVFNLTVAIGASVHLYDLRNLNKPVQANESPMDLRIRCVRSIPDSKGFAVGSIDGRVSLKMINPSNSNDTGYTFRCHPRAQDGRYYLVVVNDIEFNPFVYGTFVTGNNEGYVTAWDALSRRRLFELPRYPNSIASLSYNHEGQLLAVASSYTYQEANEIEDPPQLYIHRMNGNYIGSFSAGSSSRK